MVHCRGSRSAYHAGARIACLVGLLFGCSLGAVRALAISPTPLSVRLLSPAGDLKLRQAQSVDVRIDVDGDTGLEWTLTLQGPDGSRQLAAGSAPAFEAYVTQIEVSELLIATPYRLVLAAHDDHDAATAESTLFLPDPQYALIPLHDGNLSHLGDRTYAVDADGIQVIFPRTVADPTPLTLLNLQTGAHVVLGVPTSNNEGVKFSGDGKRLYFDGRFREDGIFDIGLGYMVFSPQTFRLIDPASASPFFSVDQSGDHVVYQIAPQESFQYALYTRDGGIRQLTNSPDAIAFSGTDCLSQFGTRPYITADGGTVVFITASTLGLVPPDPNVGCRVFAYDVATDTFTQRATLPPTLFHIGVPALSDDGRWLSFAVILRRPDGSSRGRPALVDLHTGELTLPLVDTGDFTSFDSAVTGDGKGVVFSTQADLDPRVGNRDHNLELFFYDRETEEVTQITDTIAGVGRTPGGCESYRPSISRDGSVMAFAFYRISVEGCFLDAAQRQATDDLNFGMVRAVRKRPGNQAVRLDRIVDPRLLAGTTLTMTFTAQDPDGDPVYFFAQTKGGMDVPSGSTITDNYDGTATFEWKTRPTDVGSTVLRVAAFDGGGGEDLQDVRITIVARECPGDCDNDGTVSLDERLTVTDIALEKLSPSACPPYSQANAVSITDLVAATLPCN